MTPRQFAVLAAAAALSLVAAIAVYTASAPWTSGTASAGKLAPGLEAALPDVTRIVIDQGGTEAVIAQTDDAWLIQSNDGYPASPEKVRTFLNALAGAELIEQKTAIEDRYGKLDVEDPAKDNAARMVRVENEDGKALAELIVGKTRCGQTGGAAEGTYVRRPGDKQSWLADKRIVGGTALRDWAAPRVFEVPTETVARVTVEIPGEDILTVYVWAPADADADGWSRRWTWRIFTAEVEVRFRRDDSGVIIARAFDDFGAEQPPDAEGLWNFKGYMNNAWPRVTVRR